VTTTYGGDEMIRLTIGACYWDFFNAWLVALWFSLQIPFLDWEGAELFFICIVMAL